MIKIKIMEKNILMTCTINYLLAEANLGNIIAVEYLKELSNKKVNQFENYVEILNKEEVIIENVITNNIDLEDFINKKGLTKKEAIEIISKYVKSE